MTVAQEATPSGLSPTVSRTAEQLFHEHSGWLYGYCLRLLRSPEEAEDAVQATYLNACKSLGQGTRPRAGSAWLLHIARNICFTRLRSARRRDGVERVGDIAVLEETVAAPDHAHDSLVGLTDALLSLPERQREAILLREWQGLSHGEVAARLGITHSAAETLIFRARRSLADALENPGKRSRFRALHVLDLAALLGPLKGLLAGGVSVKAAATAVTVAALTTTVTVVTSDPPGFLESERAPAAASARADASDAAVATTALLAPAAAVFAAPSPIAVDPPASSRPDGGRERGRATAEDARAKPKSNAGNGNANGIGNGNEQGAENGKALGKANQPPPQNSNGGATPTSGSSETAPAPTAPAPTAPAEPVPPPQAKAIGLGKDKTASSS